MTLYEYLCECGCVFELWRKRKTKTVKCPKCGGKAKRQFTNTATIYNGEGFTKQVKGKRNE